MSNPRFDTLRSLPCCRCGKSPVQVAHSNFYEHGKGRGIKAGDEYTIPLCHTCHSWLDGYWELNRKQAKKWFAEHLAMVNEAINVRIDTVF